MTQPDGFTPTDAANFGSLAEWAGKTQEDWENGLKDAEVERWGLFRDGLYGSMPTGQPFIMTLLTELAKSLLGLDPTTFFDTLDDIWDSLTGWATDLWGEATERWNAVMTQLTALWTLVSSGPVSAAAWATWWSNFLTAIGVGSTDAATIANWLSGNYDAAKVAKANWDAFLAGWGIGTPAAIGAAAALNVARTQRKAENDNIIWGDPLHKTYPVGSITDTATTLVGGKRTWWGAVNDNLLLVSQMLGLSPVPADSTADVGTFVQATKTQVITNEGTLAAVQSKVDALVTADTSVAGRKYVESASGGVSASWGANWATTATNANIAPKSNHDLYALTLASTSSIDLKLKGRYANVTLTDDQIVSVVFNQAAQSMFGGAGPQNTLKARMDSAGNNYVYCRVTYNSVQLGYCTSGTEQTPWATFSGTVPAGAIVELQCGTAAGHRLYQVRVNGAVVITYTEVGTSSQMGASYRGGGQDALASHGTLNDLWPPAEVNQFTLKDTNVVATTYGTSARWYRNTTAFVAKNRNAVVPMVDDVFNIVDYASPDVALTSTGIFIQTPGRYRLQYSVRYWVGTTGGSNPGTSGANVFPTAPALIRNNGSATIYAECTLTNASDLGTDASFEFNAIGDGVEAWYPAIDNPGGSGTFGIVGDGSGIATWMTLTRIA